MELGRANQSNWRNATKVTIPSGTRVLSLRGECDSNFDCGIKGSFKNGAVTDSSWKCHTEAASGWNGPVFNDSSWPAAVEHAFNKKSCFGAVRGVDSGASWIWTADAMYDERAYCRLSVVKKAEST